MFTFLAEQWVPRFILNDRNGYALAKAIEAALQYMNEKVQQGFDCLTNVDKMPEWRLDELAWEYNADWYDYAAELSEKRRMIKTAVKTYVKIGTVQRITEIVESVKGSGSVEEGFEYGGQAYHFRVFANGFQVDQASHERLLAMIEKGKNLRSVLDQICYYAECHPGEVWALTAATGAEGQGFGIAVLEEEN